MEAYIATFIRPESYGPYPTADAILGEEWIRERAAQSSKPIPAPRRGLNSSTLGQMRARRAHPVISEIIEVAEGRKDRLLRMALLDDALTAIRPHMDPTTLRPRLRSDDEYEKVEFELLTAAAYARHGCILRPNFGTPGPDFAVSIGASGPAWIECKRKDTVTQLEERMQGFRVKVDNDLISALRREDLLFHVNFYVLDDLTSIDPTELIQATLDLCRSRDWGTESFGDRLRMEVMKLAEPGMALPEEVLQMFLSKRLAMRTSQVAVRDGQLQPESRSNPIQVQWIVPKDAGGRSKGLENSLREAASQLPRSGPGIVYIDLNAREHAEAQEGLDRANRDVSRLLSGQFKRVNYVVLSAIFPSSTSDGVEGWSFNMMLFRQKRPRTELPIDLPVLGVAPHFERAWFVGDWLHDRYSATDGLRGVLAVPVPDRYRG